MEVVGKLGDSYVEFEEQTVVVTGGGSGIGAATARLFADQGARVVVGDVDFGRAEAVATELAHCKGVAEPVAVDVCDAGMVDALFEAASDLGEGRVDVVAHCAGIVHVGSILDSSPDIVQRVMDVNLGGTFNVCRSSITLMKSTGGGSIVLMGSMASLRGYSEFSAYSATKGGVLVLAKCLGLEWAHKNIRVNVICPGVVRTEMQRQIVTSIHNAPPADDREFDEWLKPQLSTYQALNRFATPEEIGRAVVYLASDAATFITGTALSIDGGATA